jgi:hypothetical protein
MSHFSAQSGTFAGKQASKGETERKTLRIVGTGWTGMRMHRSHPPLKSGGNAGNVVPRSLPNRPLGRLLKMFIDLQITALVAQKAQMKAQSSRAMATTILLRMRRLAAKRRKREWSRFCAFQLRARTSGAVRFGGARVLC